jgi:4-diphosphocytidyl-2C-methyl-D-erythritol kinase
MRDVAALAEAPAHLSGSGSALFVLCHDELHADALAQAIRDRLGHPAVAARTWSAESRT